ncbi:armadillo repeat protein deleted in velo-cardio-facial syndrome homolog isoform X7 [Haliotis rufescens]|uniref:armadillo repeat protein deleted in velo-cardio-facial syndrome homolog isoform X7 n=1 Tax=Haliotis rufescens TaxID=6454 RepID=UPI00201F3797|nr:armadillo repeat protein deleted in velo-cardio-facial syndrome homolog isoform X7 [Haliotis rufescens]
MPAGGDTYDDHALMQSYQLQTNESFNVADESAASILKSVKAQEAQFERLTRELEVERESVAHQLNQHRLGSDSGSMTSADDSYMWRGQPSSQQTSYYEDDPSHLADTSKMSSHLLDSCLRELEDRGTLNTGYVREDGRMDYMHEDPYSGHYNSSPGMGYGGGNYGNPNMSYDREHSPHGSHVSLQSAGSNRGRQTKVPTVSRIIASEELGPRGSLSSLPQEQQNGNYATYQSISRHGDGIRGSPLPRDQYPGSRGSYNTPSELGAPYRGGQPTYGDYDDRYPEPPLPSDPYREIPLDDSQHQALPHGDPYNGGHPDEINRSYGDPQYRDQPYDDDGYRGPPRYDEHDASRDADPHYGGHPDDSFRGPTEVPGYRNSYQDPPYDSYGSRPGEDYGHLPETGNEPQYGGSYQGHPDDPNTDPNDPRFRENYQNNPEDPYGDRHENPYGGSIGPQGDVDDPRYRNSYQGHPDDPYADRPGDDPDLIRRMQGLPPLRKDPFADDPFQETRNGSYPGLRPGEEDPYNRGPSPSQAFRWRNPDLQEVIDYLGHRDNDIKVHAAAYLQHLTFMDDGIKAKTRGLDGIRPLIQLLSNDFPEVHKAACGALQNLSYGRTNDENKKAIRNEGGIPELIRLLRKSHEDDVRESVTGVLWNLSSCEELKKPIIDDGLAVIVNVVIIPHSGMDRTGATPYRDHEPWTTTFRNATGVLRNVSSAGFDARKKIRECRGLVKALIHTLKIATEGDMDNKPVENVVCILRNLSYRIQEIEDPDFYKKRTLPRNRAPPEKAGDSTGCFGGGGKNKKGVQKKGGNEPNSPNQKTQPTFPQTAIEYKGLWGADVVHLDSLLLKNASNPVTLEAAAGAIQNLTACDWQPAVDIRALVRKEKGLPNLVDLLTFENDRVVCAAATALRNLAIDERNKELVGKYAMQQLVRKLPAHRQMPGPVAPDDTLCAVIATLYEVIKNNQDFALSLMTENGIPRLLNITKSENQYLARTVKYAHTVMRTMWTFRALHPEYSRMGLTEKDFLMFTAACRAEGSKYSNLSSSVSPVASNHTTPYNTLNRPISAQGYDDNTLSPGRPLQKRPNNSNDHSHNEADGYFSMNQSHSHLNDHDRHNYSHDSRQDDIPMTDLGPGYAPLEEPQPPPHRNKPPVGGVALFPNMQQEPADQSGEPLYAKVNKKGQRRNDDYVHSSKVMLDAGGGPQGGADSWV